MQALAKMAHKMGQKVGLVSEAPKDEQLEKFKTRLTKLKEMITVLQGNFKEYAASVQKMSQLSCSVSKDITQFYTKSPARTKSVQAFADAHFTLDSTTYQIFTDDFGWEVLKAFDDWRAEVDKVLSNIATTEKMRAKVLMLRESVTDHESREASLTPSQKKALEASRKDLVTSNQLYAKMYAALKEKVDRLVDGRFADFDKCFVRLMECQRDFFSAGMKLSEAFVPAISNYRKHHPKGSEATGAGGSHPKKGPRPPADTPPGGKPQKAVDTSAAAADARNGERKTRTPDTAPDPPPRGKKLERRMSKDDNSLPDNQEKIERLTVDVQASEEDHKRAQTDTAKQKPQTGPVDVMGLDDFFTPTHSKSKGKKGPSFASEEEIAAEEAAARSASQPVESPAPSPDKPTRAPPKSATVDLFDMGGMDDGATVPANTSPPKAGSNKVPPRDLLQRQNTLDSLFGSDEMPEEDTLHTSNSLASDFDMLGGGGGAAPAAPGGPSTSKKKAAPKSSLAPPDDPFDMFDPLSGQNTPEEPNSPKNKIDTSNIRYDGQVDSHEYGDLLGSGADKAKKAIKKRVKSPEQVAQEKADYLKNRKPGETPVEYVSRKGAEEAIARAREQDAKKEADADARRDLEDTVGAELNKWKMKDGVPRKMAVLLTSMHSVLWENSGWSTPNLADMMEPRKLKRAYMKSSLILHPDRQPPDASPRRQLVSRFLFEALNEAKEREGL